MTGQRIEETASGLLLVSDENQEPQTEKATELPTVPGWVCKMYGRRYYDAHSQDFAQNALDDLYSILQKQGRSIIRTEAQKAKHQRLKSLVDQLAVELLGGVPELFESPS